MWLSFPFWIAINFPADGCYNYSILNDDNRKSSYDTPLGGELCDNKLSKGWYRFEEAAGTKMPTERVPAYRCGTDWSGWLKGAHPTLEDGEVKREVCFSDRDTGCTGERNILVKNCGSFYIYYLHATLCPWRYCGTNEWGAKKLEKKRNWMWWFMNSFVNLSVFYIRVNFNWSC